MSEAISPTSGSSQVSSVPASGPGSQIAQASAGATVGGTWQDLEQKDKKFADALKMGIAIQITHDMKAHADEFKRILAEARENDSKATT